MNKKILTILLSIVVIIEIAFFIVTMPPSTTTQPSSNPNPNARFSMIEVENPDLTRHNTIYLTIIGATIVLGTIGISIAPRNDSVGDSD